MIQQQLPVLHLHTAHIFWVRLVRPGLSLEPSVQQSIVKRDRFDARPIDGWRSPHNLSDTVHPPVINTQLEGARTTSAVRLHWDSSHGSCDRHILPVFQSYSADQGARAKRIRHFGRHSRPLSIFISFTIPYDPDNTEYGSKFSTVVYSNILKTFLVQNWNKFM